MQRVIGFSTLFLAFGLSQPASTEELKICYRPDAAPFSFLTDAGEPDGYSVDICRRVALKYNWDATMVEVTSENRFDMLTSKACDVVCEATTVNMERREDKEFSLISFITGAVFLYPKGLGDETQPEGEVKVGLLSGTTIDEDVKDGWLESGDGIDFTFERQESHEQGAVKLAEGGLHAYVADREIIEQFLEDHPSLRDSHEVTRESLSYEPYALAVRLGDDKLRIEIDRVLAEMFRSGEINELLQTHIPSRRYDPVLNRLFEIQSLPK